MKKYLSGWKTYVAAGFIISTIILQAMGYKDIAEKLWALGIALGFVGLRGVAGRIILQMKTNGFIKDIASGTVEVPKEEKELADNIM